MKNIGIIKGLRTGGKGISPITAKMNIAVKTQEKLSGPGLEEGVNNRYLLRSFDRWRLLSLFFLDKEPSDGSQTIIENVHNLYPEIIFNIFAKRDVLKVHVDGNLRSGKTQGKAIAGAPEFTTTDRQREADRTFLQARSGESGSKRQEAGSYLIQPQPARLQLGYGNGKLPKEIWLEERRLKKFWTLTRYLNENWKMDRHKAGYQSSDRLGHRLQDDGRRAEGTGKDAIGLDLSGQYGRIVDNRPSGYRLVELSVRDIQRDDGIGSESRTGRIGVEDRQSGKGRLLSQNVMGPVQQDILGARIIKRNEVGGLLQTSLIHEMVSGTGGVGRIQVSHKSAAVWDPNREAVQERHAGEQPAGYSDVISPGAAFTIAGILKKHLAVSIPGKKIFERSGSDIRVLPELNISEDRRTAAYGQEAAMVLADLSSGGQQVRTDGKTGSASSSAKGQPYRTFLQFEPSRRLDGKAGSRALQPEVIYMEPAGGMLHKAAIIEERRQEAGAFSEETRTRRATVQPGAGIAGSIHSDINTAGFRSMMPNLPQPEISVQRRVQRTDAQMQLYLFYRQGSPLAQNSRGYEGGGELHLHGGAQLRNGMDGTYRRMFLTRLLAAEDELNRSENIIKRAYENLGRGIEHKKGSMPGKWEKLVQSFPKATAEFTTRTERLVKGFALRKTWIELVSRLMRNILYTIKENHLERNLAAKESFEKEVTRNILLLQTRADNVDNRLVENYADCKTELAELENLIMAGRTSGMAASSMAAPSPGVMYGKNRFLSPLALIWDESVSKPVGSEAYLFREHPVLLEDSLQSGKSRQSFGQEPTRLEPQQSGGKMSSRGRTTQEAQTWYPELQEMPDRMEQGLWAKRSRNFTRASERQWLLPVKSSGMQQPKGIVEAALTHVLDNKRINKLYNGSRISLLRQEELPNVKNADRTVTGNASREAIIRRFEANRTEGVLAQNGSPMTFLNKVTYRGKAVAAAEMVILVPPSVSTDYSQGYHRSLPDITYKSEEQVLQKPERKEIVRKSLNTPLEVHQPQKQVVWDVEALNSSELNKLVDRVYSQLEARLARERRRYGY